MLFYRLACCRVDIDNSCVQVREHVELLKAAQPPIGLVICDEGALFEQDAHPLSRRSLRGLLSCRTSPQVGQDQDEQGPAIVVVHAPSDSFRHADSEQPRRVLRDAG